MLLEMATLHIRNVPPELYERLRTQAAANGRSLNAEVIVQLSRDSSDWRGNQEWWDRHVARGERIRARMSPDSPKPEDLIRADRDSR